MRNIRRAAALLVVSLPLLGLFGGTRDLAFTMYASSVWFRIDVVGTDAAGLAYPIAPTALAAQVGPTASPFFAGADHERRTYDVSSLRTQLSEVARLACHTAAPRAVAIEVTLFERRQGSAVRETKSRAKCGT